MRFSRFCGGLKDAPRRVTAVANPETGRAIKALPYKKRDELVGEHSALRGAPESVKM